MVGPFLTRINCVPVEQLHQKHLVAEYRELPRVFSLVKKYIDKHGVLPEISSEYILGTGHVKFFYDKLLYLANRHKQLINEMRRRGYKPSYETCLIDQYYDAIPAFCWNDWVPSESAMQVNQERITERIAGMKGVDNLS